MPVNRITVPGRWCKTWPHRSYILCYNLIEILYASNPTASPVNVAA
jgi:hypothetical protein